MEQRSWKAIQVLNTSFTTRHLEVKGFLNESWNEWEPKPKPDQFPTS